ncbi:hypothetical protein ACR9E3_05130 [Actinomycetospora sp. C-140]
MSIEVEPEALAETVEGMGAGYLLTLGDRPRPHVGAVDTAVVDGVVRVHGVGRTGRGDAAAHDAVTLLWAPREPGGYSLIVDGTATVAGDRLDVVPVRAVLHRPAPGAPTAGGACTADCVELPVERPAAD